jgi:polysaccharide biosynthesis/export protein
MAVGSSVALTRDMQTLFETGTAGGLTDRQLLDRFMSSAGAASEAAFEALVLRHGPMILRVCHNALGDATDAQDAFQATFLVLVKRCRSIRQLESIGGWLYGVACRVAARARVEAARRRSVERQGGLRVVEATRGDDAELGEFGPIVQEEVQRLPANYRAVVVLCFWQGMTHEQAANQLGCPLGTVRSRMARARKLLHRRLIRRGVAPLAGAVAAALDGASAPAAAVCAARLLSAVPAPLVHSTVQAATQLAAGKAVTHAASASAGALVEQILWSMTMIKACKTVAACCVIGLLVLGAGVWAQQPRRPEQRPRIGPRPEPVRTEAAQKGADRKSGPAHIVEPPDLLLVEVLEALPGRPLSGERLVRPDGTISLGFYGDIHVAGLTLTEVKEKIVRHLRKFLKDDTLGLVASDEDLNGKPAMIDPKDSDRVFVDITAYNSRNYYVEGDVYYTGRLPFTGGDTVLDVLHYAGGVMPSADRSKIRLIRSYPKGSPVQVLPIDYDEITMGTDSSSNYQIMPGDRLVVPRDPGYEQPSTKSTVRSQQRPESHSATGSYFPGLNTDSEREQLQSLRAVERHLGEVEKKLDKLIEALEGKNADTKGNQARNVRDPAARTKRSEPEDNE